MSRNYLTWIQSPSAQGRDPQQLSSLPPCISDILAPPAFPQVIKATEEFEAAMRSMQFVKEDSTDLLTYARNVNCHFANKKCQDVIVAARNLMTSEIHNTIKVLESCTALTFLNCSWFSELLLIFCSACTLLLSSLSVSLCARGYDSSCQKPKSIWFVVHLWCLDIDQFYCPKPFLNMPFLGTYLKCFCCCCS